MNAALPLKGDIAAIIVMSVTCQKQTWARLNHTIGGRKQFSRHGHGLITPSAVESNSVVCLPPGRRRAYQVPVTRIAP
jgi:hypothetical protein